MFEHGFVDATLYDELGELAAQGAPRLVVEADRGLPELLGRHPKDLSDRIHFMGAQAEPEFLSGMAVCDAVVFPYLEVGQSSSGPISQALELGCRIIASRTHAFLEFAEYHSNAIEFFDIGNHVELAERLTARRQFSPRPGLPEFNVDTNRETYRLANSRMRDPARMPRSRERLTTSRSDGARLCSGRWRSGRAEALSRAPLRACRVQPCGRGGDQASGARGSRSVTTSTTTGSSAASACCSAGAMSCGCSTRMPRTPKLFATSREIGRTEADQLLAAPRTVAGDAAHAGQVLAETGIVVDDDRRRDAAAPRRLQFGEVVVEPAIAGEAHDLARTGGALRAERGRERPAERTGGAQIGLPGAVEVDHRAGPDPGIAGIGDQHAVARQGPRDLGAQPFDRDRRRVLLGQRAPCRRASRRRSAPLPRHRSRRGPAGRRSRSSRASVAFGSPTMPVVFG